MHTLFLISDAVTPSSRWQDAFPDGVACTWDVAVSTGHRPDLVWLSAGASGWKDLLAAVLAEFEGVVAVVVSNFPNEREALSAMVAGAHGYCHAWAAPVQLQKVAQVVRGGGYWIGADLMTRLIGVVSKRSAAPAEIPKELSERESEVAREVAAGRSNKEIAVSLGITERTVKAHLGAIFIKLGVRDRLQLALSLMGGKEGKPP